MYVHKTVFPLVVHTHEYLVTFLSTLVHSNQGYHGVCTAEMALVFLSLLLSQSAFAAVTYVFAVCVFTYAVCK